MLQQYTSGGGTRTLKEDLNESIELEDRKFKLLKDEEKKLNNSMSVKEFQVQQWKALVS